MKLYMVCAFNYLEKYAQSCLDTTMGKEKCFRAMLYIFVGNLLMQKCMQIFVTVSDVHKQTCIIMFFIFVQARKCYKFFECIGKS